VGDVVALAHQVTGLPHRPVQPLADRVHVHRQVVVVTDLDQRPEVDLNQIAGRYRVAMTWLIGLVLVGAVCAWAWKRYPEAVLGGLLFAAVVGIYTLITGDGIMT
jgi:hypothetical protein